MKKTFGIFAHVDAGKTTFSEQILYYTKSIRKKGRVDYKEAFLDSQKVEKERGITVFSDVGTFSYDGDTYYLNIDVVSYYYKNKITTEHKLDDYEYYTFESNDKFGYLRITQNNEDFFVELCYNYAIIEVEVKEDNIKYAVSRGMTILNSIKYNDLVIQKHINNNSLETSETLYNIPEPKNKDESKNVLEYIDEYDENKGEED